MAKREGKAVVHIIKADEPKPDKVEKGRTSEQLSGSNDSYGAGEWLDPPLSMTGLKATITKSSILPQCIKAYKSNIAGFGIGFRYKVDEEENEAMIAEFTKAEEVLDNLNMDMDTKEVFEHIVEARESYGISYIEVLRNLSNEVDGIEFIRKNDSIRKTAPMGDYIEVDVQYKDKTTTRKRRFCKYVQTVGNNKVYFKEIGDPRVMDKRDGTYKNELDPQHHASEIMEFTIGTEPYGEIRWIGQILGVDGSREAEELNNRYFKDGRHTPLLIMIKGGTLTEASFAKLKEYMNDIKGKSGQHAFMVLEAECAESQTLLDTESKVEIEAVPLAEILQRDELFQEYLNNNRKKVQSSFLLPDLYVGYTTDFNRATAQTAMEITEEQVFQPERASLAWAINNKLLKDYNFQYVEAYFKAPIITNPEDLKNLLDVCEKAGGLTPNKAKEIAFKALGEDSEPYDGEFGDIPIAIWRQRQGEGGSKPEDVIEELDMQIEKAIKQKNGDIASVMKQVRDLLTEINKESDDAEKVEEPGLQAAAKGD